MRYSFSCPLIKRSVITAFSGCCLWLSLGMIVAICEILHVNNEKIKISDCVDFCEAEQGTRVTVTRQLLHITVNQCSHFRWQSLYWASGAKMKARTESLRALPGQTHQVRQWQRLPSGGPTSSWPWGMNKKGFWGSIKCESKNPLHKEKSAW